MPRKIDLTGCKFGRLLVAEPSGTKNGKTYWKCVCACGNQTEVSTCNLRRGDIKSCGCYQADYLDGKKQSSVRKTRLYKCWEGMKRRCNNPKCKSFKWYGARGIGVCEDWVNDFDAFRAWSLQNGYSDDFELDRVDNESGYSPENCRWVTHKVNCGNRRPASQRVTPANTPGAREGMKGEAE